ncbi:MAG: hypothetical protein UU56_C0002G0039 [Candidatus Curtissbacteria bacterium GW2011_GWA2_41_24]|uniref:DUF4352 domain-containing protein n=3 Tax=Candidatus Curtissiibacteriota TaxID=1752717 RepID=A0A0G0VVN2_9BACT|nr:MAG: hypothetical protein UU56_C0002G0039 [Candidatus Curtissbacteria bacterium GW2011_GWA2_41_24]
MFTKAPRTFTIDLMPDFDKDPPEDQDPRLPNLNIKKETNELEGVPVDPPPEPVSPQPPQPKTPEELLEEAKALSSMPVSSGESIAAKEKMSDLEKDKTDGSKSSPIGLFLAAIFLVAISGTGGYFLGKGSTGQKTILPSTAPSSQPAVNVPPTPSPSPLPSPSPAAIGDKVKLASGLTLTLDKVWLDSAYAKSKAALPDKVQVDVQVTFANEESNALSYTPTDFILKDLQDLEYKTVLNASKEYKALTLGSLLPGATIIGGVSFIAPKTEKSFRLVYEDAEIAFSLP